MANEQKILIADDEPDILEILNFNLSREGFVIAQAKNGIEALEIAPKFKPDLIILDVMMPHLGGIETCIALRKIAGVKDALIIFLTAMGDESFEVKGLEAGGDDYIVKPVSPKVLLSKVHALFRRVIKENMQSIQCGPLEIDRESFMVRYNGEDVVLARKEFELLSLLASRPGKVFLRNEILSRIWGTEVIVGDRTIDVHIRKIRQKLQLDCITTVKGVGYKFELPPGL